MTMPMPKLFCFKCRAKAQATCRCRVTYVTAGAAADLALAEHPERSNRTIAEELGVDEGTVRKARARASTAENSAVGKKWRIGRDGKRRHMPTRTKPSLDDLKHVPAAIRLVDDLLPYLHALRREHKYDDPMSPQYIGSAAAEMRKIIDEALSPLTRAEASEVCASEWEIDKAKLDDKLIDAVRKAADAWGNLLERMLAIGEQENLWTSSAPRPPRDTQEERRAE
jgi:hypothetical protein